MRKNTSGQERVNRSTCELKMRRWVNLVFYLWLVLMCFLMANSLYNSFQGSLK